MKVRILGLIILYLNVASDNLYKKNRSQVK